MMTEHHWDPDEGPRPPSPPPPTEAAAASEPAPDTVADAVAVAPFSEAQLRPLRVVLRDLHQTVKRTQPRICTVRIVFLLTRTIRFCSRAPSLHFSFWQLQAGEATEEALGAPLLFLRNCSDLHFSIRRWLRQQVWRKATAVGSIPFSL